MKTNQTPLSLAILSATTDSNIGTVALALDLSAQQDGWCQLLPAGQFKAVDGRPADVPGGHFILNGEIAARLISLANAAVNDLVIDYEHQTLNSDENGKPAPAAGWFKEMEWREGSGLWIKPQWTPRAHEFIKNGEYRFLSAVFPYDKRTGEPLSLHSAALVNRPGIDGMQAVEALRAQIKPQQQETPAMNETMRKLLAQLGIELSDKQLPNEEQSTAALAALNALTKKAADSEELETQVASLKANNGNKETDLSEYVPAATYNALFDEVAALKAGTDQASLEQVLKDAQEEGKVLAAEMDYLIQFGKQQGVAALKGMLEKRPSLAALKAQQTDGKDKPDADSKTDIASLSAQELKVCKNAGISPEDYLKNKGDL